ARARGRAGTQRLPKPGPGGGGGAPPPDVLEADAAGRPRQVVRLDRAADGRERAGVQHRPARGVDDVQGVAVGRAAVHVEVAGAGGGDVDVDPVVAAQGGEDGGGAGRGAHRVRGR